MQLHGVQGGILAADTDVQQNCVVIFPHNFQSLNHGNDVLILNAVGFGLLFHQDFLLGKEFLQFADSIFGNTIIEENVAKMDGVPFQTGVEKKSDAGATAADDMEVPL